MKDRERTVVTGLVVLLATLWMGFLLHRSPPFAGSFWGGVLGVLGSALMLVPLAYSVVKRVTPLKRLVTRRLSMQTLLAAHVYAGILGPILVLLHTGHKFESRLGVALTALTLLVVFSGFAGRYMLRRSSRSIQEKRQLLTQLESAYRETARELAAQPRQVSLSRPFSARVFSQWVFGALARPRGDGGEAARAVALVQSIADVEYAIETHELFRTAFGRWLKFHIVISLILYALLVLHVWAGIHFGIRWFA